MLLLRNMPGCPKHALSSAPQSATDGKRALDETHIDLLCRDNDALANWLTSTFSRSILVVLRTVLAGRTGSTVDPSIISHVVERLSLHKRLRSRLSADLRAGRDPGSLIRGVARMIGHELLRDHCSIGSCIEHLAPEDYLRLAITHDIPDTNPDRTALITQLREERAALPADSQRVLRERVTERREFDKIANRMNSDRTSPDLTAQSVAQLYESAITHLRTRLAHNLRLER
jgi:hypothetical protein